MSAFMIAAAHKSSGKTVISTGLTAALTSRGHGVQCFKKGPDYIDPMWLSTASGRACYNLDFNTMTPQELIDLFAQKSRGADVTLVEANKGLYDGVDLAGADSNAQLAKILGLPVVLVIDTNGITRGIAPLLQGYQGFDPEVNIAGVILNKVGGARHESKLVAAVSAYTNIKVLGAIHRNTDLDIGERHLGLTTPGETSALAKTIEKFGQIIADGVDLDDLLATTQVDRAREEVIQATISPRDSDVRIGIIKDEAFGFYYSDDLAAFEDAGAKLVEINSLKDNKLPPIDGLFIGGGFPEMCAEMLAKNTNLKNQVRDAIASGLPTYAECGGLMYLCRCIVFEGSKHQMAGVIDADTIMYKKPQGRGYVGFADTDTHPWGGGENYLAHEFHYARLEILTHPLHLAAP